MNTKKIENRIYKINILNVPTDRRLILRINNMYNHHMQFYIMCRKPNSMCVHYYLAFVIHHKKV